MPYITSALLLCLLLLTPPAFGATGSPTGGGGDDNPVERALKQASQEAFGALNKRAEKDLDLTGDTATHEKSGAEKSVEDAVSDNAQDTRKDVDAPGADQDPENSGPEQAIYPGVKNMRLQSGGNGEPTSTLWYPQLGNEAVDASLRDFVEKAAADYENQVHEGIDDDGEKPESWGQWEQNGFFTFSKPSPDIASITFNIYNYTGGAHGQIYVIVLNYDLKTGKQLALSDLFGNVDEALRIMSGVSATTLRKNLGEDTDDDMLADGTEPTEANFSALSLLPNGVSVEFQPYQVGPWSIGQQHVDISLEELAPANPNPHIWPKQK